MANRAEIALASDAGRMVAGEHPQPEDVANSIAAGFMVREDATEEQMEASAPYLC